MAKDTVEISFNVTKKGNLQLLADVLEDKGKTKFLIGKEENYTPLLATGALHNSIKPTSDGVEMEGYGLWHAVGFETGAGSMIPGKNVPRRRFHIAVMNKKTAKRISNEIRKNLSKNIRKIIKPEMKMKL